MADVKRAVRVAEQVRAELARLLQRKVKDPRVAGVVISRIDMADDLGHARVFFRLLSGDDAEAKTVEQGLSRAASMLRREITSALKLRVAPELKFVYDRGLDNQSRVEALLAEIEHEERTKKKRESKE